MARIEEGDESHFLVVADLWRAGYPLLPISVQQLVDEFRAEPQFRPRHWIAWEGQEPVGLGILERNMGSYHPLKWMQYVVVRPDKRLGGLGKALLECTKSALTEPPLSIQTRIMEDDEVSLAFARKRGFEDVKLDFESELRLPRVNLEALSAVEPQLTEGYSVRTIEEVDTPAWRREFFELFEVVRADTPRVDPPTPMTFEYFEDQVIELSELERVGSQMAYHEGKLVAFSTMYRGADEGRLDQGLTAVKREHRGSGLATAMKVRQIRWALENGHQVIRTDNDTRNAPMLRVNEKLGFQRLKGMITLLWQPPDSTPE